MYGYFSFSPASPASTPSNSYSSYSTSPMEIPISSSPQSPSCAYPSWPRRSSLSGREAKSTSFIISDEELFADVFDEAESDCTPSTTPRLSRSPSSPSNLCDMVVTTGSLMRQLVAEEKAKKSKKERRRGSSAGKKSRTSSGSKMSPIQEVGE